LYEAYPRLDIDVEHEQKLLLEHDVIIFQHPFYWYSTPPILKQWQDLVLQHGWAYGSTGTALQGKTFLSAISAGAGEGAYCSAGYNHGAAATRPRRTDRPAVRHAVSSAIRGIRHPRPHTRGHRPA
jgi:glutathione-regulated potassium-efflux system ancillary protein KefG